MIHIKQLIFTAMKMFIILLLSIFLLASCAPEEEPVFRLDPNAMISIKPDPTAFQPTMLRSSKGYLSAMEIVKQTSVMQFRNEPYFGIGVAERGFSEGQRDTSAANPCLKMFGTDIIDQFGNYTPEFIEGHDVILIHFTYVQSETIRDTIGYIPNAVVRAAEDSIKIALASNDTEAVYRIFNNAFTFRPITGAEWIALKMQGLQ